MAVCVHAKWLQSCPIFGTPWTVACQAPLSMEFSRQESWSGLPFPSPRAFTKGSNPCLLHLLHCQVGSLPQASPGKHKKKLAGSVSWLDPLSLTQQLHLSLFLGSFTKKRLYEHKLNLCWQWISESWQDRKEHLPLDLSLLAGLKNPVLAWGIKLPNITKVWIERSCSRGKSVTLIWSTFDKIPSSHYRPVPSPCSESPLKITPWLWGYSLPSL